VLDSLAEPVALGSSDGGELHAASTNARPTPPAAKATVLRRWIPLLSCSSTSSWSAWIPAPSCVARGTSDRCKRLHS